MAKALTREDLLYILQSVFRISEQENNAFQMLDDGLYVDNSHAIDENLHIDKTLKEILNGFTVTSAGVLLYNETPVNISISLKEDNGISVEEDGLYIPNVNQEAKEHLENKTIHVTQVDKDNWNGILQTTKDEISKLIIYDVEIVSILPATPIVQDTSENPELDENVKIEEIPMPSSTTLYLLENDPDCPEECVYTMHMFLRDQWVKLGVTNKTLAKYALKEEVENSITNSHTHTNKEVLDKFSVNENGDLTYNNTNIHEIDLSIKPNNAAQMIDGKLFIEDLKDEIKSLEVSAAWAKVNLYDKEISDSGVYELKDTIDSYNILLVEYYYKPNDETEQPGCAKTAVIDTDVIKELYGKGIDYMLEYGYGIMTSNSKIRMYDNKIWVDYYHNVCIYKITGIRRGDDNG